jgi:putative PIN family toxin of toxin-antitoxin system
MRCAGRGVHRAVLDPGVLVSALITPSGTAARLLTKAWTGAIALIASPLLLAELSGVLGREKFRRYVDSETVDAYVEALHRQATVAADPTGPPPLRCADPDDDYLIALASDQNAVLVSGDSHLLDLAGEAPIFSPAEFLKTLAD